MCFASRGVDLRGWGLNSRKHTALASDIGGEVVNGRGEGMCCCAPRVRGVAGAMQRQVRVVRGAVGPTMVYAVSAVAGGCWATPELSIAGR